MQVDLIWVLVNVLEKKTSETIDRFNHKRFFNRQEFVQALVRLACVAWLDEDEAGRGDVPAAIRAMCEHMRVKLPPEALQDSNSYRRKYAYTQLVDTELRRHETSLRHLFDHYKRGNNNFGDCMQNTNMMSFGEWYRLIDDVGLVRSGQISYFGAKCIFKWSRIRSAREYGAAADMKLRNLYFEVTKMRNLPLLNSQSLSHFLISYSLCI